MAENVKDLRTRIRSVKNTAKLTRAMKMVSAAKLRRSQEAMFGARPYAHGLRRVLGCLVALLEIHLANGHQRMSQSIVRILGQRDACFPLRVGKPAGVDQESRAFDMCGHR